MGCGASSQADAKPQAPSAAQAAPAKPASTAQAPSPAQGKPAAPAAPQSVPAASDGDGDALEGLVTVTIIGAKEIAASDMVGKVDPYVTAAFGTATFKTKSKSSTVNPEWNQSFKFPVLKKQREYSVVFSIFDKDFVSENDFIGTVLLPLQRVLGDLPGHADLWVPMYASRNPQPSDKPVAQLHLAFKYLDAAGVEGYFWETLVSMYDKSGDKQLDRAELGAMFATMGVDLSDEELDVLFSKVDKNQDATLSVQELLELRRASQHGALIRFTECPICGAKLGDASDTKMVCHVGVCFVEGEGAAKDLFAMKQFVTETQASKGFASKLFGKMMYGAKMNEAGNIMVLERKTGQLLEEKIPAYVRIPLLTMYHSKLGRSAVEGTKVRETLQKMTIDYGPKYNDAGSVKYIEDFIKFHDLNVNEMDRPPAEYATFNEFFYRKLRPGVRPVKDPEDAATCVSPADSRVMAFPTVDDATRLWIKGKEFSVGALLGDAGLAAEFEGGSLAIFRLAPQDYHRYHCPVDGTFASCKELPGAYFTVNPIAVRQDVNVYTENRRNIALFESPAFGKVAYVIIGATCVGSIVLTKTVGEAVKRGDEIGYFAFGGSTVICVWQKGRIQFDADLLEHSAQPLETLLQVGMSVGRALAPAEAPAPAAEAPAPPAPASDPAPAPDSAAAAPPADAEASS
eukprot:tig00021504_g21972.t1